MNESLDGPHIIPSRPTVKVRDTLLYLSQESFLYRFSLPFTAKKVAKGSSDFIPSVSDTEITKTASYKYLGIPVDSTLNMKTFFDK